MLIKHLRDYTRTPFATIVALSKDSIGVALCNIEKDSFNKRLGTKIALGRAMCNNKIPQINKYVFMSNNPSFGIDCEHINDVIADEVEKMRIRAERYYK